MANKTGDRVRELRNKLDLSQDQLGKMLGYTGKAAISKIETGVNGIAFDKVNDFACAQPAESLSEKESSLCSSSVHLRRISEPIEALFFLNGEVLVFYMDCPQNG